MAEDEIIRPAPLDFGLGGIRLALTAAGFGVDSS
jgi:hypothetical protein